MGAKPLPALPLAAGARVAAIGDSLVANGIHGLNGYIFTKITSAFNWLAYCQGRLRNFNMDTWSDAAEPVNGWSGSNWGRGSQAFGPLSGRPGINSYLSGLIAKAPAIVVSAGGTNNILAGDDTMPAAPDEAGGLAANLAYLKGRISEQIAACRNAGILLILSTIPISGTYAKDSTRDTLRRQLNAWIMSQHSPADGRYSWDRAASAELGDGALDSKCFQSDTIHYSTMGAWKASQSLDAILSSIIASGDIFATLRSGSSLWTNTSGMVGTGGGNGSATTVSGDITASFGLQTLATTGAARVVASKEVITPGVAEKQVLAISPNGQANSALLSMQAIPPALVAGDWYRVFAEIEDDGSLQWTRLYLEANATEGASTVKCSSAAYQNYSVDQVRSDQAINLGSEFLLIGNPVQVPSGFTIGRLRGQVLITWPASASAFTVKIKRVGAFKVSDPRPAWGY